MHPSHLLWILMLTFAPTCMSAQLHAQGIAQQNVAKEKVGEQIVGERKAGEQPKDRQPVGDIVLQLATEQRDYFVNSQCSIPLLVRVRDDQRIMVSWRVRVANRTWQAGSRGLETTDRQAKMDIQFQAPAPKDGLVLKAALELEAISQDGQQSVRQVVQLGFFPRDPFALEHEWSKSLNVCVLESDSALRKCLQSIDFPYRAVRMSFTEPPAGLLIIGQDVTRNESSQTIIQKWQAASQPVLMLNTHTGLWQVSSEANWRLARVNLEPCSIDLEDDLSTIDITSCVTNRTASLLRKSSQYVCHIDDKEQGWQSLVVSEKRADKTDKESQFETRLAYHSLDVVSNWDTRPTPRYLLKSLLKTFSSNLP